MQGPLASLVATGAGILVAFSPLLEWIRLNSAGVAFAQGGVGGSAQGIEIGTYGWIAMILGALLVATGIPHLLTRTFGSTPHLMALVAGIATLGTALLVFTTLDSRFIDFAVREAASSQLSAIKIRSLLGKLFADGSISVRPGMGLTILAVGGGLGVAAGMLGLAGMSSAQQKKPRPAKVPVPETRSRKDRYGF